MEAFGQQLGYVLTEATGIRRNWSIKLCLTTVVLTSARQMTGAKNSVHSVTIITMPCSVVFNWDNLESMKQSVWGLKFLFVGRRKVGRFLFLFAFFYSFPSKACMGIKIWNLIYAEKWTKSCLHKKQLRVFLDMARVTVVSFDLGFQLGASPRVILNMLI